ncbi:unnamed protein product, partial [Symbiodinium necroappetens]
KTRAEEASCPEPCGGKRKAENLVILEEPVNRASAFMKLRGTRKLILESGYSLFETLGFFLVRERGGHMTVGWRDSTIPGGFAGRRFSGVDEGDEPPEDFCDVPHAFSCTSAFAHSRLVKEANFEGCPGIVKEYNHNRDGFIADVRSAYGCSRDVAKRLFIRLGFMGG